MQQPLKNLMATTFGVPPDDVPDGAAADLYPPWNSLGHLELMMALEMEYRVRIPAQMMSELTSTESIEAFLRCEGVLS
jgi:acyl carrier protein